MKALDKLACDTLLRQPLAASQLSSPDLFQSQKTGLQLFQHAELQYLKLQED